MNRDHLLRDYRVVPTPENRFDPALRCPTLIAAPSCVMTTAARFSGATYTTVTALLIVLTTPRQIDFFIDEIVGPNFSLSHLQNIDGINILAENSAGRAFYVDDLRLD